MFFKSFGDYACEVEIEALLDITDQTAFNLFQE